VEIFEKKFVKLQIYNMNAKYLASFIKKLLKKVKILFFKKLFRKNINLKYSKVYKF